MDAFAAANELQAEDPAMVAHRWLTEVYEPVAAMVPPERRATLEPAEFFHEILEHRWYLSEEAGLEINIFDAADTYVSLGISPASDSVTTAAKSASPRRTAAS